MFWDWFSKHCKDLGENFDNEKLLTEIDDRLTDLGGFAWEIGPGTKADNQLVISPGGDLSLLPVTKGIVSYAKIIPGWEFHYAKPPKEWDLIFDFEKDNGDLIEIDASNWQYVLLKYEDGKFEIIIQVHDLDGLSENDKLVASGILLDGILGEEVRMLRISYIDVVRKIDNQYASKSTDIKYLDNHLKTLL
ncbi:hypothetical protein [Pedobacter hiemivivus]|uniref:DUF695 domain-containing protein n=1 Tax=Pedobacter hiemivivus TaxID=2530454 RepID=A0A4R0NKG2_9SPHI|nr:hypothetical protein [Pedobacter hiemivivus]TCC99444.1 hypothetical protein EZ444_01845 [Pedobacter hiemivivus]